MEYKWIAQDRDGGIFKWRNKPIPADVDWFYGGHDFYQRGRENPNWKNSLINLETHDYKIEDGILMKVEKEQIFKGGELQFKNSCGEWVDCHPSDIYRIKPKTKTVRFRNYLTVHNDIQVTTGNTPNFKQWLGDWQEVEVQDEQ